MKACNQCGKCCIKYADGGLYASPEDIALWELFNPDIYEYVKNGQIWFDPKTGKKLSYCPFLEIESDTHTQNIENPKPAIKYTCSIYQDRPEDCRHYPSLIEEMVRDGCEMIEITDLNNITKAQTELDDLMQDSRYD